MMTTELRELVLGVSRGVLPPGGVRPSVARPIAEATKPWESVEVEGRWRNRYKAKSLREGGLKYIWTPWAETEELYDLESDPGEERDLTDSMDPRYREVAARLRRELERVMLEARPLASELDDSLKSETMERLRRLGYFDSRSR